MEDSVIATYRLQSGSGNMADIAKFLVELETTGGFKAGEAVSELFRRCTGEVVDIQHETPSSAIVKLAFPLANFDMERNAFSSIWLTLVGGGTHALLNYEASRLLDFDMAEHAARAFPGPQFGPSGIRRLLGVEDSELLLGTIVKPTAGLTVAEVTRICQESAAGGLRFIKDDEKMMNVSYCPLAERVRSVMATLRKVEDETGQSCLYAPHITGGPELLLENARVAVDLGAPALMLNVFASGFHALETLARHPEINVPIYAHCGGKEAFGRAPDQGVAPEVVAKFIRLMGGDMARVGAIGGYMVGNTDAELRSLTAAYSGGWRGVPPVLPAVSGGLKPANLADNLDMFGNGVFYLAGTGVTKHPYGIAGGVRAMQLAAEGRSNGIPTTTYAAEHEVLAQGLTY